MNENAPLVTVIVVNYNGLHFVRDCFDALASCDYPGQSLEILCVDNGSSDGSPELVRKEFPHVRIISNKVNTFSGANNTGIKQSSGEYVVLLNNDTKVAPGWLQPLVQAMEEQPGIGAIQSKLLFFDGKLQSLGHIRYPDFYWEDRGMGEPDQGQYGNELREVDSLCGACTMYRKKCLDQVGLLDEDFPFYMEDVDMALRCHAKGWRTVCQPESVVYHFSHGSIKTEENARIRSEANRLLLIAKHWPESLADNLVGRGFFLKPNGNVRNAFLPAVAKACDKVVAVHPKRVSRPVLQAVFSKLQDTQIPARDAMVKKAMQLLEDQEGTSHRLYAEIDRLRDLVLQREEEIQLLRDSLSYRYVLRPVQRTVDRVRDAMPVVRKRPTEMGPFLPEIVSMKFTNNCQLKCRMCGIWNQRQEPELSTRQWQEAIDRVYDWLGPYRMDIAGGEPLLREDNDELVAHAANKGIETVMLSNGALINKSRARKMLDSGLDSIHISLDSLKPEVHDRMRGVKGTFAQATRAIKHFKDLRRYRSKEFSIGIATIIMASTVDGLVDLARFVYEGGADFQCFQPLDQNFHHEYDPEWFTKNAYWVTDTQRLYTVLERLAALKLRGYPIDNSSEQLLAIKHYFSNPKEFCQKTQCLSGEKNFIVRNNGDVLLCWNLPPVGNILKDSPSRIWTSPEARKRREQISRCPRTCRVLSCHFKEEAMGSG